MKRALVPALLVALAVHGLPVEAAPRADSLAGPRLTRDAGGRIRWWSAPPRVQDPDAERFRAALGLSPMGADSLRAWRTLAGGTPLAALSAYALHRSARQAVAMGDTSFADSAWARVAATPGLWQWEAIDARVRLALARRDTVRADSLLGAAAGRDWPEAERAAWTARRATLRAARRDTVEALALARLTIRLFPATPPAAIALALLDTLTRARGDTLSTADQKTGAEVAFFRGDRTGAARRLESALAGGPAETRWATALRLSEVQRARRRWADARSSSARAVALAPDSAALARALLERARGYRDGAQLDSALALFDAASRLARDSTTRETAAWEAGRAAEDEGQWSAARVRFARVTALGGPRLDAAIFRAGLMDFIAGADDSARTWWARGAGEASRFWLGVALRRAGASAGDTLLRALANTAGSTFYRTVARDTLGIASPCAAALPAADTSNASNAMPLRFARALAELGVGDDAARVLSRWGAGDPRLLAPAAAGRSDALLAGARIAYFAGRWPLGIGLADRAIAAAANDSLVCALFPWTYPPAYESLFVARDTAALEPALLLGVTRQESRFDARARSSSNALGLMQLLPAAAGDMAKLLHDPPPTESTLFDPALNVRYGTLYLKRLIRRFDGRVAVALSAYNAGPGTLPPHWRELIARGGEALFCELASNADAQDYVRKILANRQAYRELRPTFAP